jgi:pimeloyl-ACP methyl ester carboxylesterase
MNTVPSASETPVPVQKQPHQRGCLFYIKRTLVALVILIVVLCLLGFVYESSAELRDRQTYLPPGQLFDVDGHQMHIVCSGEGSPTVILEAGAGHFSASWAWVQATVAQSTHVCAYDRAGYGWSDPGPEPRDAQQVAAELHALLVLAGVEPPYVMAGHSVGGIYIRVYNAQYPGEVVGMVMVDATHPDNWARQGESIAALRAMTSLAAVTSRVGLFRLFASAQHFDLPDEDNAAIIANMSSSRYWDTQRADAEAAEATIDEAHASGDLGDLPLAVLAAGVYPEGPGKAVKFSLQHELAALSTNSIYQEIAGASHMEMLTKTQYAALVSEAIIRVVDSAQTGEPLAK